LPPSGMSTPRSHNGCWTCKKLRRKCDKARPNCQECIRRGVSCEGYEIRLRWGSGIASRGRFTGAGEPVEASIPPRLKGRRRDLSRERRRKLASKSNDNVQNSDNVGKIPVTPLPVSGAAAGSSVTTTEGSSLLMSEDLPMKEKEKLFQEFLTSGINVLHSTSVHDTRNLLESKLPTLCQSSRSLYAICVALQASISPKLRCRFFEHYDVALNQFRAELSSSVTYLQDGTLTAGLLLCSIGLMHSMPWTMHLRGMYGILQAHGLNDPGEPQTEFRTHLLEVMGVMDLPTFTIGRVASLGFWRQHCRDRGTSQYRSDADEVEVVSGLPRSLLDIISCIGEGATEEDFWDWPGSPGSLHQHQLWEAHRLAGMLALRLGHLLLDFPADEAVIGSAVVVDRKGRGGRPFNSPKTTIITSRIVSHLDALCRALTQPEGHDSLILNAIKYPVFIAGLQADVVNADAELKEVIRRCLSAWQEQQGYARDYQLLLEILEEWWLRHGEMSSVHELALRRGMEIGLL
ncbi:hypothetical protein BBP40_012774, partial [Aspergillus hancockii]